jgi:hypothetical protein
MSKKEKIEVPEATGVIVGCVFLIVTFLMIPVTFSDYLITTDLVGDVKNTFPHKEFAQVSFNQKFCGHSDQFDCLNCFACLNYFTSQKVSSPEFLLWLMDKEQ